ncbi:helix-turn-helix domain-containing protein [Cupriavidus lacunae]|uniref:helix-turn-helix domain-containing protein n=1 Tax=Cupriavidus lacunae TaxID=2666307 RepID=UPI001058DB72|nr:helix-turn-helix domain-containing protein [Cupriavidus lacunae]
MPKQNELRRNEGQNIVTVRRAEQTEGGVMHRIGVYMIGGRVMPVATICENWLLRLQELAVRHSYLGLAAAYPP